MDLLQIITNACDALSNATSPPSTPLICTSFYLATIMMSWFGIQEALAAQGHENGR